eukprot:6768084-Alexandrium_andersonii.AAC.1
MKEILASDGTAFPIAAICKHAIMVSLDMVRFRKLPEFCDIMNRAIKDLPSNVRDSVGCDMAVRVVERALGKLAPSMG